MDKTALQETRDRDIRTNAMKPAPTLQELFEGRLVRCVIYLLRESHPWLTIVAGPYRKKFNYIADHFWGDVCEYGIPEHALFRGKAADNLLRFAGIMVAAIAKTVDADRLIQGRVHISFGWRNKYDVRCAIKVWYPMNYNDRQKRALGLTGLNEG